MVYDATWTLLVANDPYDALMGDTTLWAGPARNAVWRHVTGLPNRTVHSEEERAELQANLVADLRRTVSRYPADHALRRLVDQMRASARFVGLWEAGDLEPPVDQGRRKLVDHPSVHPDPGSGHQLVADSPGFWGHIGN